MRWRYRNDYRPVLFGAIALAVCIGIGSVVAGWWGAYVLFNVWAVVTGIVSTAHMIRYRDHRQAGAIPALVGWTLWFLTTLVLGTTVLSR
jgi:hypothetical protein